MKLRPCDQWKNSIILHCSFNPLAAQLQTQEEIQIFQDAHSQGMSLSVARKESQRSFHFIQTLEEDLNYTL